MTYNTKEMRTMQIAAIAIKTILPNVRLELFNGGV